MRPLFKYFSRGDWVIIGALLVVAGAGFLLNLQGNFKKGTSVVIEYRNHPIYRLPLNKDQSLSVPGDSGGLVLQIRKGKVWVSQSHCPHKICMRMGKISRPGQIIVCVPNRIVIRITGPNQPTFDVITQ
ncbi:MAG: NusG domain II-containing protein [Calditrichaeota bacterium]|nr:NusG domain II-containing protein [Calditrichota bacterium]